MDVLLEWKNDEGIPLKKPWTVATNHEGIGKTLSKYQCKCSQSHAQGRGMALKRTEEYTFKMTDAIHRALVQQQRSLKTACCALVSLALHSSTVMLARAIQMAKDSAVAGRPAIYERICAWERTLTIFRGAIAVTTWDEPQVLLQQMEGCRLPISNIVSSTVGGGNNEGSYEALTEVYDKTPDGYLAFCP